MNVTKRTGRQVHPKGGVVDLTHEERERFKSRRIELGYTHRTLGDRIGCSSGTISNIETGRSGQPTREVYGAAYAVLFGPKAPEGVDVDTWKKMMSGLAEAPEIWEGILALVDKVKNKPQR
jgi:DNA-binding XRE family transcriptional regulator